jgi:hypothetical protein
MSQKSLAHRSTRSQANSRVDPTPPTADVDGLCGKTRKMTGRENLDFARRTSSAQVIVTMAVYGRLNCDRREKSSFSTQST